MKNPMIKDLPIGTRLLFLNEPHILVSFGLVNYATFKNENNGSFIKHSRYLNVTLLINNKDHGNS